MKKSITLSDQLYDLQEAYHLAKLARDDTLLAELTPKINDLAFQVDREKVTNRYLSNQRKIARLYSGYFSQSEWRKLDAQNETAFKSEIDKLRKHHNQRMED